MFFCSLTDCYSFRNWTAFNRAFKHCAICWMKVTSVSTVLRRSADEVKREARGASIRKKKAKRKKEHQQKDGGGWWTLSRSGRDTWCCCHAILVSAAAASQAEAVWWCLADGCKDSKQSGWFTFRLGTWRGRAKNGCHFFGVFAFKDYHIISKFLSNFPCGYRGLSPQ